MSAGFGMIGFPGGGAASWWRWVDMCEAEGADSLWLSDRLVGDQPVLECMTGLAALAGRTRRLKFGMNILALALREPVLVAKQCATIDVLSEGRLLPAFGIGSPLAAEWRALGLDAGGRGGRTDEALEIIARLWRGETLDFGGRHFRLAGASIHPTPVQEDLPMWIGGSSPAAVRRTARFGTGWQGGIETPEQIAPIVAAIAEAAAATGRTIDADHYGVTVFFRFGAPADAGTGAGVAALSARIGIELSAVAVIGDADDIVARLAEFVAAGVSKFVMIPLATEDDDLLGQTRIFLSNVAPRLAGLAG